MSETGERRLAGQDYEQPHQEAGRGGLLLSPASFILLPGGWSAQDAVYGFEGAHILVQQPVADGRRGCAAGNLGKGVGWVKTALALDVFPQLPTLLQTRRIPHEHSEVRSSAAGLV